MLIFSNILVSKKVRERREAARTAGADRVVDPDAEYPCSVVHADGGQGVDAVVECCGDPDALRQAVMMLEPGGRLVIVGIPAQTFITLDPHVMRRKEIAMYNVRRQNRCMPRAIDRLARGQIEADFMLTHRFKPEQAAEAFALLAGYQDGVIKATLRF